MLGRKIENVQGREDAAGTQEFMKYVCTLLVQLFKVNVLYDAPNGELSIASASHVKQQLETILRAAEDPARFPVGILTTQHRDTWALMRERLASGEGGRRV